MSPDKLTLPFEVAYSESQAKSQKI